jgi:hypothetical protein
MNPMPDRQQPARSSSHCEHRARQSPSLGGPLLRFRVGHLEVNRIRAPAWPRAECGDSRGWGARARAAPSRRVGFFLRPDSARWRIYRKERPGERIRASQIDLDSAILERFGEFGSLCPRPAGELAGGSVPGRQAGADCAGSLTLASISRPASPLIRRCSRRGKAGDGAPERQQNQPFQGDSVPESLGERCLLRAHRRRAAGSFHPSQLLQSSPIPAGFSRLCRRSRVPLVPSWRSLAQDGKDSRLQTPGSRNCST